MPDMTNISKSGEPSQTTIDVVIPILDEVESLKVQVNRLNDYITEYCSENSHDVNIIIADNGSSDGSYEAGLELQAEIQRVSILKTNKRGVGLALKTAWFASDADIVGYMDLDLATDLKHFPEAISSLTDEDYDVVTGSRLLRGSVVKGRSALREVTSRVFNLLLKVHFKNTFKDGMCGFKFLQRRHLQKIFETGAQNDGWFFATELLICAEHLGLRVKELPVVWTDDSESKAKVGKLARQYMADMQALKQKLKQNGSAENV